MPNTMNQRNQMQWVVLLAAAVVVPTVSLLWFMSRVVTNERLVIQQKLGTIYHQRLQEAVNQAGLRTQSRINALGETDWTSNPYGLLRRAVLEEGFQGVLMWSPDGELVYPSTGDTPNPNERMAGPLAEAWQLEFVEQEYAAAAERYGQLAQSDDSRALAGLVRCLARLERWDEAVQAVLATQKISAAPARMLLLSRLMEAEPAPGRQEKQERLAAALEQDLFKAGSDYLPAGQNEVIARRLLACMKPDGQPGRQNAAEKLTMLVDAEQLSLNATAVYSKPPATPDTIMPAVIAGSSRYIVRHPTPFGNMMLVCSDEGLASAFEGLRDAFDHEEVAFRILDARGRLIAGEASEGAPVIVAAPLPQSFPDGKVELVFADGGVFSRAADRQVAVYVWTAVLVILLMLLVGVFAGRAVGRQIRLNKMKNDFIATVSHELRTPLASMRLLVDTLLEKRVRDEAHAEQYLRMIARENERLTRMIENFLTFSRMERNKNAFTMDLTSPASIVEDAVESVCTKFEANHCRLKTNIADALPDIPADHDAIVTVLTNLLDNACKYTTDNKRIELKVSAEADEVCFAVSDNGIGLSQRQIRKIFDSFYQVDDSLARGTEGCGLGLSIVQFIVNAHKGRIDVESQPGKGSTFAVRLPLTRKNGA